MTALGNLDERIAKLEAAAEDIKRATRDAHAATKDLVHATKEARALMTTLLQDEVDQRISDAVKEGLEQYRDTLAKATDDGYAHVIAEFEKVTNLCLYGNVEGTGVNVLDAVRAKLRQASAALGAVVDETATPEFFRKRT